MNSNKQKNLFLILLAVIIPVYILANPGVRLDIHKTGTANQLSTYEGVGAIGWNNYASNSVPDNVSANTGLMVGHSHVIRNQAQLVSGVGNWPLSINQSAFGYGLRSPTGHGGSVMVGKYNDQETGAGKDFSKHVLFVVGNGPSTNQRSNAFIVYDDGDVVIKKEQGDISMGSYQ